MKKNGGALGMRRNIPSKREARRTSKLKRDRDKEDLENKPNKEEICKKNRKEIR